MPDPPKPGTALGARLPAPEEDAGLNLEWFRPDPRPRLYGTWRVAALLVVVGSITCGLAFLGLRQTGPAEELSALMMLAGLVMTAGGMLLMVRRALWVLADETCLVLRVDGIRIDRAGLRMLVPWASIDGVEVEGEVLLLRTDHPQLGTVRVATRFTDLAPAEVARRISETRRRALMGLLRRRGL